MTFRTEVGDQDFKVELELTGNHLLGLRACFVKEEGKIWFE
jgi:hypothetical protein